MAVASKIEKKLEIDIYNTLILDSWKGKVQRDCKI